jgi:NF-kappa-B-activating protein
MKKARQAPPNEYWDKKLLEAEEKDPGRWKHSGYKKMYVNGVRKSRSRSPMRKTPVSPHRGARNFPQSPIRRRMSRTPERYKPRSPPPARYPREMVKPKEIYRPVKGRPVSPPPKVRKFQEFSSKQM